MKLMAEVPASSVARAKRVAKSSAMVLCASARYRNSELPSAMATTMLNMSPLDLVRRYWNLPANQRRIALEAAVVPIAIAAGFYCLGVSKTRRLLGKWAVKSQFPPESDTVSLTIRVQRAVNRKTGLGGTCLVRSLSLWAMLRRRGVDCVLQIGVRKNGSKMEGHAWLEHAGEPINERPDVAATYVPFGGPDILSDWRSLK